MHKISIYLLLLILSACTPNLDYEIRGYTEKIIVQGSIADGEYPRIYLSLNVPLSEPIDSATILKKVIRTAKVTISDGINTEILTSKWEREHFPPYVYVGTELKGKAGVRYYLTVEYGGYKLTGQTGIPESVDVQNFTFTPVNGRDSLRILGVRIQMSENEKKGYLVHTKLHTDKKFHGTRIVYNEQLNLSGLQRFVISPQHPSSTGGYFRVGDTIRIKVSAIDSTSTVFFGGLYEKGGVGSDIFTGQSKSLNSNISKPGFGVWYGAATSYYQLIVN
jgi:hypothetical protein